MPPPRFLRCPRCQLPHEVGLSKCPITGEPLEKQGLRDELRDTDTTRPAHTQTDELIGALIEGKYEIRSELGRGSMGQVYRARHMRIGRDVAIKILLPAFAESTRTRTRFMREATATGRVEHENVAQVWDVGVTDDGRPFLVMELVRGESLGVRLERERRLPLADALAIAHQLLAGLTAAHQAGVAHRDVKPENILLSTGDTVKIVDFGVARVLDSDAFRITGEGDVMGTPRYFSPEQAKGKTVDQRADAWAATVVLYEMVTGEMPFPGRNLVEVLAAITHAPTPRPSAIRSYLPEELDGIIEAGLVKDAESRASVGALLDLVVRLEHKLDGTDEEERWEAGQAGGPSRRGRDPLAETQDEPEEYPVRPASADTIEEPPMSFEPDGKSS